jgi:DNA polymerase
MGLSAVAIPRRKWRGRSGEVSASPNAQNRPTASTPLARQRVGTISPPPAAKKGAPVRSAPVQASPARPVTSRSSEMPPARSSQAFSSPVLIPPRSAEPFTAAPLPIEERVRRLKLLDENEVRGCTRCRLWEGRTQTVFGEGDPRARIFFIGEGPGENEDLKGRPFVGRAGEMLDKWIAAMGLRREQVFIANIVKCRPPKNRCPMPDEVATCTPYLERQLEIVRPEVIVTLGLPALKYMMNDPKLTMNRSRGQWRQWRGVKLMPTFHPAYVLRLYTEETRSAVWSDLKTVMSELGLPMPRK